MTNEEAIRMLIRIKDRINFEVTDAQEKMDALNMAIAALEQEPCDAVSRKAAIDACLKGLNRKEMVSNIKALPPVAPAERVAHWEYVQYDGNPNIGN